MKKILKFFTIKFFLLLVILNQNAISKSLPPGSGAGDVKANILILLDTSLSMTKKPFGGAAIYYPGDLILLDSGDVIVGQGSSGAIVKFRYSDEQFDNSFVDPDGDGSGQRIFMGSNSMPSCVLETGRQNTQIRNVGSMDISKDVNGMGTSEVIYAVAREMEKVIAIDADGGCVEAIDPAQLGKRGSGGFSKIYPRGLDIRTISSEDHLIVTGIDVNCTSTRTRGRGKRRRTTCAGYDYQAVWFARNLTTGVEKVCTVATSEDFNLREALHNSLSIALDDGKNAYFVYGSSIYKYPIEKDADGVYCPKSGQTTTVFTPGQNGSDFNYPTQIDIDPESDSIMYATSNYNNTVEKLAISTSAITTTTTVGSYSTDATPSTGTPVNLSQPGGLFVSEDRVWIGGNKVSIQEFDISVGDNITWVDEMGTSVKSRAQGAKEAIIAVVNDSSLTSGAYFGFGYWNAGTKYRGGKGAAGKWCRECEYTCHREGPRKKGWKRYWDFNDNCDYYRGWAGNHPTGKSNMCDWNSCISVGVGPNTTNQIIDSVKASTSRLRFGTDAGSFSQMALEYYQDPNVNLINANAEIDPVTGEPCELNYVIVIGDGDWTHHDDAVDRIEILRQDPYNVKTIVFAYGGGIKDSADDKFQEMAQAGSCPGNPSFGTDNPDAACRQRVIAESPADLVTKLKSEVERIIASRLSFTAPSITASIQEGGDLYQAQFEYMKHGEWTGHLMRKEITAKGKVKHDAAGNWNASEKVREQALLGDDGRNIWTVLKNADYKVGYNNFTTDNATLINKLFQLSGKKVADFYNTNSKCSGDRGNTDDIEGLIKFVRGEDYFAYGGECDDRSLIRASVLGDIYHSQIVEVGKPSASTLYTSTNQEAYYRSKNGYNQWAASLANRARTLYVGANDGMLHAFDAVTGAERWAFVPPFVASRLPEIINDTLEGIGGTERGGTNSIFAVDGSPVVHDMYIRGLDSTGGLETAPGWHTILMVPYGRGGRGFSVLDVTDPVAPIHMFSLLNDWDNRKVMIAKENGEIINGDPNNEITGLKYTGGSMSSDQSLEAQRAILNQQIAYDKDLVSDPTGDTFTERDLVVTCKSDSTFYVSGTSACFNGTTYTFNYQLPQSVIDDPASLDVYEMTGATRTKMTVINAVQDGSLAKITFSAAKYFNVAQGDNVEEFDTESFDILIPNAGTGDPIYDYSTLGETWSAPRIFRLPVDPDQGLDDDKYVAVLPGGFGKTAGLGSSVFVIDLETMADQTGVNYPGKIVAGGDGLIKIADLDNSFSDNAGNSYADIPNSITGDPVVITPDTFRGARWRGAMVYVNDFEGKITKINLTSAQDTGGKIVAPTVVELFDHTTLFSLNTNQENGRYSYFGMDAAYGSDSKNLYLFGSTGDFGDIGYKNKGQDNLLYGIKDIDFPNFRMVNLGTVGSYVEAQNAKSVDHNYAINTQYCINTAEGTGDCPAKNKHAWVFKLDKPYNKQTDIHPHAKDAAGNDITGENKYRKASASPTVFKGTVYYPVYEPPYGKASCAVGNAFICSADDECGTNTSDQIEYAAQATGQDSKFDNDSGCYYLQPGVLSKLVVFSDRLFANITTSSDDQKDTLVSLLSNEGNVSVFRGSWRENY